MWNLLPCWTQHPGALGTLETRRRGSLNSHWCLTKSCSHLKLASPTQVPLGKTFKKIGKVQGSRSIILTCYEILFYSKISIKIYYLTSKGKVLNLVMVVPGGGGGGGGGRSSGLMRYFHYSMCLKSCYNLTSLSIMYYSTPKGEPFTYWWW